jgi:hypothetical protein
MTRLTVEGETPALLAISLIVLFIAATSSFRESVKFMHDFEWLHYAKGMFPCQEKLISAAVEQKGYRKTREEQMEKHKLSLDM